MVTPELSLATLAIVIPALNEAASIERVVIGLLAYGQVIVVDDGSTDKTAQLAREAGALVVSHRTSQGYDNALASGFKAAAEAGCASVVTIDADGQLPVEKIPVFFEYLLEGYDMVVGARQSRPRISEHLFAWIMQLIGSPVLDPFCGLKAYKLEFYNSLGHFDSYRSIGTELMLYVLYSKGRVLSVPIQVAPRDGVSRMGSLLIGEVKVLRAVWCGVLRLSGLRAFHGKPN